MSKKSHPSPEFVKDLKKVFTKHNWSGAAIGLKAPKGIDSPSSDDDDGPEVCPDGSPPQEVWYQDAAGNWKIRRICR